LQSSAERLPHEQVDLAAQTQLSPERPQQVDALTILILACGWLLLRNLEQICKFVLESFMIKVKEKVGLSSI
jgi:hypothetical protein